MGKCPSVIHHRRVQTDLNIDKLKLQLAILPDVISTVNKDKPYWNKTCYKVSTVCDVFNEGKFPKSMLKMSINCYIYI